MPRANRHFLPGHVWHITHRCHQKAFLLKFARDRDRYLHWVFEAKKRLGLRVLNYMVTSNHVHLLVQDTKPQIIAQSMQLIAGRSAQEYNQRKSRQGAFWEDRYHATAVETDMHLHRCLVYIDLNMVRAGVTKHPAEWEHSGYLEIQAPPKRYAIIALAELASLCGFGDVAAFQEAHRQWVQTALTDGAVARDESWSAAIAVGSERFVNQVRCELGVKALHRAVSESDGSHVLRESASAYTSDFGAEMTSLRPDNTVLWGLNTQSSEP